MKRQLEHPAEATKRRTKRNCQWCSIHGKQRTMLNMSQNEQGEWICIEGKTCQVDNKSTMCTLHKRVRTFENLKQNDEGQWVCNPEVQCQVAVVKEEAEMLMCSVHQRLRTSENLSKNPGGEWVCNAGCRCQLGPDPTGSNERQLCIVHERMRTVQNMEMNVENEWECIEGARCKGGSSSTPKGTKKKKSGKKKKKRAKPSSEASSESMLENPQYIAGNFRGALQEHFQNKGELTFDKAEQRVKEDGGTPTGVFLSKCRIENNDDTDGKEGLGYGSKKKQALQFAALDLIMKLKLVTPKQHLEMHPETLSSEA